MSPGPSNPNDRAAREAVQLAAHLYGLEPRARRLDGDVYRNFLLKGPDGARLVLKIAPKNADPQRVELQLAALRHLQQGSVAIPCPCPVPARDGTYLQRADGGLLFVLQWVPGTLMADVPAGPGLAESIGRAAACLHDALNDFEHPGLYTQCNWDLRRSLVAREKLDNIAESDRRRQLKTILDLFESRVDSTLVQFEQGPIHGDLNDHNILVDGDSVAGILDFGDMTRSARIADLAIAAAYAMFHSPQPFDSVTGILAGYHRRRPLEEEEITLVPEMIAMRLAFSVINSSWRQKLRPDDPYLSVSEKPAWATLALLDPVGLDRLRAQILRRCPGG